MMEQISKSHIETKMPGLIIAGSLYLLDIQHEQFVHSNHPEGAIAFKDLKKDETDYVFEFNSYDGRLATVEDYERFEDAFYVRNIRIPEAILLRGYQEGGLLAEKVNERAYREQTGAVLIDDTIRRRLSGELPTLEIGKSTFTVDIEHRQLLSVDGKHALPLTAFQKDAWDINHLVIYESVVPSSRNGQEDGTSETAILRFPSEIRLDPVGYALHQHMQPMKYLSDLPIVMQQKAAIEQGLTVQVHREQAENETPEPLIKQPKRQKGGKYL